MVRRRRAKYFSREPRRKSLHRARSLIWQRICRSRASTFAGSIPIRSPRPHQPSKSFPWSNERSQNRRVPSGGLAPYLRPAGAPMAAPLKNLHSSIAAFENLDAYPRGWLATPVALDATTAAVAIRQGRLPNGAPFDARVEATTFRARASAGGDLESTRYGSRNRRTSIARDVGRRDCVRPGGLFRRGVRSHGWRALRVALGLRQPCFPRSWHCACVVVPAQIGAVAFAFIPPVALYVGPAASCPAAASCCPLEPNGSQRRRDRSGRRVR